MLELVAGLLFAFAQAAPNSGAADWLIDPSTYTARVDRGRAQVVALDNGLIRREIRIAPNGATVALDDLRTGQSLLRGVKPEATLTLDGVAYNVGGLVGQPNYAFLRPDWEAALTTDPAAFQLVDFGEAATSAPFPWKRTRRATNQEWPPAGRAHWFDYRLSDSARPSVANVRVRIWYELYDGLPVVAKWLEVHNEGDSTVHLDRFTSEVLAVVEAESTVESRSDLRRPALEVLSDYAFGGMSIEGANQAARWIPDPQYSTQVNYQRDAPLQLEVGPALGPGVAIAPETHFTSFRAYELLHDSTQRERQGLAIRRTFRTLAPWVTENPTFMHVRSAEPDAVRLAIDQCAEVGFELVIMTFGSGFNIESEDPAYAASIKELVDYAHERGIGLGGYSLFSSRRIGPQDDVIDPATGEPGGATFGNAPCACSPWGEAYFAKLKSFIRATGLDLLEHDGPYPGDVCGSSTHPGHRGLEDSQWRQWEKSRDLYRWCRARGVYLNVPDFYFLAGSNKIAMGYRETNWSLPRADQVIHGRQNIFDGTWEKTPSMGWMFVPLTEYHGGGAAATIEPLHDHLDAYEAHLANNFGAGVQACYRGPRLFDTPETRAVVARWTAFFNEHRDILESDVIHIRRADGRQLDALLHVNPRLPERGMLMVYNPLDSPVTTDLRVPLYYTGLTDHAVVTGPDGEPQQLALARDYSIQLPVAVAAGKSSYYIIE